MTGLAFYHTMSSCVIVHHSDVRLHNDEHNRSGFLSHEELLRYSSPFKDVHASTVTNVTGLAFYRTLSSCVTARHSVTCVIA